MTNHDPASADGAGGSTDDAEGVAVWHKVAEPADSPEGRVRTITVDGRTLALSRHGGRCGALDNRCPHQGGPLGEGTIEGDLLRCPWHGYDYDPITGRPPPPFTDAPGSFEVEERPDGVHVALPPRRPHERTRKPATTGIRSRGHGGCVTDGSRLSTGAVGLQAGHLTTRESFTEVPEALD